MDWMCLVTIHDRAYSHSKRTAFRAVHAAERERVSDMMDQLYFIIMYTHVKPSHIADAHIYGTIV